MQKHWDVIRSDNGGESWRQIARLSRVAHRIV